MVLVDDVSQAFARVEQIRQEEGRTFVHPFEGPLTALGTATVGLEFCTQVPDLDAVIIPIGGGGLAAGMATAVNALQPACKVYGVEPKGADSMYRSFQAGSPQAIEKVQTFADSLGAPYALPQSYALCREFVDEIVLIDDDEMRRAMALLFHSMKLAVEPAGAAATAALCGPLLERLRGQRVGVLVCGTNIDIESFALRCRCGAGVPVFVRTWAAFAEAAGFLEGSAEDKRRGAFRRGRRLVVSLEPLIGLEPMTCALRGRCSTD